MVIVSKTAINEFSLSIQMLLTLYCTDIMLVNWLTGQSFRI